MPVYDYKCNTCGAVFEYKQKMSESPIDKCPVELCTSEVKGQGSVQRIMSKNVGLIFKGTGFYQTDYVTKDKPKTETPAASHGCASGGCGCAAPAKSDVA